MVFLRTWLWFYDLEGKWWAQQQHIVSSGSAELHLTHLLSRPLFLYLNQSMAMVSAECLKTAGMKERYYFLTVCLPKIYMLKSKIPKMIVLGGSTFGRCLSWEWSPHGWDQCLCERGSREIISPFTRWGHKWAGNRYEAGSDLASILIFVFPASRTMRNKFLLLLRYRVWNFVIAAWTDWDKSLIYKCASLFWSSWFSIQVIC